MSMTTKLARVWLKDLRAAADVEGPTVDDATLASVDLGLGDVAAGRVKSLDQYEGERGL